MIVVTKTAHRSCNPRGFTLTELSIVLGIIGVILGAIWTAASMVYENNRVKIATNEILTIVNNWHEVFGSKKIDIDTTGGATGTDVTGLTANNNFAPAEMYGVPAAGAGSAVTYCAKEGNASGTACTLESPWGASVSVFAIATVNGLGVSYLGLSQEACNRLANALSASSSLIQLYIEGTLLTQLPPLKAGGTIGGAIPTSAQINTACDAADGTNSVEPVFSLN